MARLAPVEPHCLLCKYMSSLSLLLLFGVHMCRSLVVLLLFTDLGKGIWVLKLINCVKIYI